MTEIDHSLRRLGTDYVDLYQIHRWDPHTPIEETLEALHDVVKAGQGALHRRVLDVGVAVQQGAARGRAQRLDPVRHACRTTTTCSPRGGAGDAAALRRPGHRRDPVEPAGPRPADPRLGRDDRPLGDRRVRQHALLPTSDRRIVDAVARDRRVARACPGPGRAGLGAAPAGGDRADRRRDQAGTTSTTRSPRSTSSCPTTRPRGSRSPTRRDCPRVSEPADKVGRVAETRIVLVRHGESLAQERQVVGGPRVCRALRARRPPGRGVARPAAAVRGAGRGRPRSTRR